MPVGIGSWYGPEILGSLLWKTGGWSSRNGKGREQWEELALLGLEQSSDWVYGGRQNQGQERDDSVNEGPPGPQLLVSC